MDSFKKAIVFLLTIILLVQLAILFQLTKRPPLTLGEFEAANPDKQEQLLMQLPISYNFVEVEGGTLAIQGSVNVNGPIEVYGEVDLSR